MTSRIPVGYIHAMRNHQSHRHAFSLVELSIVLVILGLLVGGILAGQSLIRASELRSVITDLDKHRAALFTFRDKYFGLPGDITNATSFWGDQATGTGACSDAAIANGTPGTCNGNGDGKIIHGAYTETTRAWQQLAMAGLIEGTYTGTGLPNMPRDTVPQARVSLAGYALGWYTTTANYTSDTSNPNRFVFGSSAGGTMSGAALRAEETWNIDTKMDDAKAQQGRLFARTGNASSPVIVADGACVSGSEYNLSNAGIACSFTYVAD